MPNDYKIDTFNKGTITRFDDIKQLPRGSASDSLNWLTRGDRIEVRRGYALLGTTRQTGIGRVTGLVVGEQADGTEVPFFTHGRKIKHYDSDSDDTVETGSDRLPAGAEGEDIAMQTYKNLGGAWVYASSRNSSIYKIAVANPASVMDLSSTTHKGFIRIKQGRMFLWDRLDSDEVGDETGLYGSFIDKDELSDYTETTNENVGTGDGTEVTFTATLSVVSAVKTAHGVRVTDTVEIFTEDRNGLLVGDKGGTGTINYVTGAISVTFNTAPANLQAITADYYTEDATSEGIADFTKSTPRTAGQGFVFRQDEGGSFKNLFSINDVEFCFHEKKTYKLTLTSDDTNATNLIYRERVGTPYFRAAHEIGDGILYLDNTDKNDPRLRILTFARGSTEVIPISLSDALDLEDYRFDKAEVNDWGEYYVLSCRHKDSDNNNTMFAYNKQWKVWDRLDYWVSASGIYNGTLIVGDSVSDNVYTLFSGVDDDGSNILNFWESGEIDLDVPGLKKVMRLVVDGFIGPDQTIIIKLSYDGDPFVKVAEYRGDGGYVDRSQSVAVGASTLGTPEIGGGSVGGAISAFHFRRELVIATDRFEYLKYRVEGTRLGWAAINSITFKDIRFKGRKIATKYSS